MAPVPDTHPDSLTTALALAEFGFGVFSVWGIKDGVCRCPKGAKCPDSPGKHPIPRDGFKAASLDPDRIRAMLRAAGSAGNYGVCPAENTIIIDVDGEGWQDRLRTLGLPKTLAVLTGNGIHLYFYWPAKYGPAPTHLFGWKVRSHAHAGYVVGPGSLHQSGVYYRFAHQNGHTNEEMVATIKPFPKALVPPDKKPTLGLKTVESITVSEGPKQPEDIREGGRHDYLRDAAYYLSRRGLPDDAVWEAVWAINLRLPQPKTEAEVRRAIGDAGRFGVDADVGGAPQAVATATQASPLIIPAQTYVAGTVRNPRWASPLAVFGHVSLISGPAKSGKSTLISGLVREREKGNFYLWGQPIPVGPTLFISEESGASFADKIDGLTLTDVMDWSMFVRSGLNKRDHVIELLAQWCAGKTDPMVVIDTLAVWSLIKDENDAMETNRAIGDFSTLADTYGAAVLMGHHSRKGGGANGEGIRGSSAIFGAVALSIEFGYFDAQTDPRRKLLFSGRFGSPTTETIEFDPATREYERIFATPRYDDLTKHIPLEASGTPGLTRDDLRGIWGKDPRNDIKKLLDGGQLVERTAKVGRVTKTIYFKTPALLDLTGSVSEEMANIFATKEDPD